MDLVEGTESNRRIVSSWREDLGVSWELKGVAVIVEGEQELEGEVTRSVVDKGQ